MITDLKHLTLALRLCEIPRWGIVAMARQQSTAEHSYRVTMIAVAIYHYMGGGVPHNSDEQRDLVSLCLYHDMFEVLSGDLDSIFKGMLESMHPGVYDDTVQEVAKKRGLGGLHSQLAGLERSARGSVVEPLKKIADLVEAYLYLLTYGANSFERARILKNLRERLFHKIAESASSTLLLGYNWNRCAAFVTALIDGQPIDTSEGAVAVAIKEPWLPVGPLLSCRGRDSEDGGQCCLTEGHAGQCYSA